MLTVSKKPGAGVELCVVCGCAECAGEYGGAGAGLPVRGLQDAPVPVRLPPVRSTPTLRNFF